MSGHGESGSPGLAALTGGGAAVPRPAFRWRTRVALPGAILLSGAGLLAYAAREQFAPVIDVEVAPVVLRAAPAGGGAEAGRAGEPEAQAKPSGPAVVAPGWIEPDPFPAGVPALVEGVVREVLVLEGQTVEANGVVARLVDEDLKLAYDEAEAEVAEREAETARARAAIGPAQAAVAVAEAEEAALRDEVTRKGPLVQAGGVSEGDYRRLELRLRSAEAMTRRERSELALMEADVPRMLAAEGVARVALARAALDLSRAEVRAAHGGVVLRINARPGSRAVMAGPGAESLADGLVLLYDPASLQVRTDVPLAEAARVGVGTRAEITTEALPGRVFSGVVSRVVHQADIQRNTVQFKVRVEHPDAVLKPEMLCRVKFNPGGAEPGSDAGRAAQHAGSALGVLVADERAIVERRGDEGVAWVVVPGPGETGRVERREVRLAGHGGGVVQVLDGLRPGDRVVLNPPRSLREGSRVRAREGAEGGGA
ncbi:MAG: efflux RND transporter periplasmic adaptor subunit [Phycisphaerales bacterium]|nr:efflux RND transporter periplasmic adaptor subunit [Phycisphaerales bacterium]